MSQRYPGGFITKTPTAPTSSAAPGIWTVDQAMQNQKAGNWPSPPSPYIEDWFSTYVYTGTSASRTLTNGINLSANGGLVWFKSRSGAYNHALIDSVRGGGQVLSSNTTSAQADYSPQGISAFNTDGFTFGTATAELNNSSNTYVSWTFAKRQKFFDVVTYTGNGTAGRTVAHNLGSAPGCIIVKQTSGGQQWAVYHRSNGATKYMYLDATNAAGTSSNFWNNTDPTSSVFTVGAGGEVNGSGSTYVAYLFAHDAGGFGLTGSDNVITCGSVTADGSGNATVNLGYEPQFILIKSSSEVNGWAMIDTMRGLPADGLARFLFANTSGAESGGGLVNINATGFYANATLSASATYIYIAIRRGPMKVPTTGTSVFAPVTSSATGSVLTSNFPVDMGLIAGRGVYERGINDRLRGFANADPGASPWLVTQSTAAETLNSNNPSLYNANNTSIQTGAYFGSASAVSYLFRRAPGFFDEVCYTGTASSQTLAHNLAAVPEMMIVKDRTTGGLNWPVYSASLGNAQWIKLNLTDAATSASASFWNLTTPTSSVFTVGTALSNSGYTYVAYLFATCPGVSKVGSYTGTAALLTVNCGFTTGARFVLIKRTDSTGDWYTYDSARGISSGNDPYLFLNTNAAETTGTNYVDTDTTGFKVTAAAPAGLNANGGTYIFLAIA